MENSAIKILLVEDSAAEARLIRENLSDLGAAQFDITHADRLETAFARLDAAPFDIVLLDLGLPDSKGVETLAAVRAHKPQQAVVVLTGLDDEQMGVRLVQEGAEDYLVKSRIDGNLLVRAIRYAIERNKNQREKESLEERLRQAQKLEAIGALAGGIAHDFNNLLGAIGGYADLLKTRLEDNPKLARYATHILTAATRGAHLTGKLLSFARKAKIVPRQIDLHAVITELKEVLTHTFDPRIKVEYRLDAPKSQILGDANEMTNALLNLAINAKDAMPEGGSLKFETACVTAPPDGVIENNGAPSENGYLQIRVSDTGTGMSDATLEHAFDPFFTTKEIGKGTGLGLASVYGCMKQHSGHITVESELGKGSTFILYLPLSPADAPMETKETSAADSGDRTGRILIVDDEAMMRECAAEMLVDKGYEIVSCANGAEAVEVYQKAEKPFDLVLLDLIMPVMNGIECFNRLRQINPAACIVLCSGYDDAGKEGEKVRQEAQGYIRKPFESAGLLRIVAQALASGKPKNS